MNRYSSGLTADQSHDVPLLLGEGLDRLLRQLAAVKYDTEKMLEAIGDVMEKHAMPKGAFRFKKNAYSRSILLREDCGFEIMVARWDRDAVTPIHGHPGYSLLYVVEGTLKETLFVNDGGRIQKGEESQLQPGFYSYHKGEQGRYDNAIHQIKALKESLSLHIYSDDALKGQVFQHISR